MKPSLVIMLLLIGPATAAGQKDSIKIRTDSLPGRFYVLQKVTRDGETLPEIEIKEVTISGKKKPGQAFQYWRYERLVYNVKTVYPYAVLVRTRLASVNTDLEKIEGDRDRKEYIKGVEKQIFKDYEADMRDMTIAQGKILIKLIDRETQNTSFELIREYKGKISAAFWQGIARICGTNLKDEYDPDGEDALIEKIVNEIESGHL